MNGKNLFIILLCLYSAMNVSAMDREAPNFTWNLLWTGSYYNSFRIAEGENPEAGNIFSGGTLYNRLNLSLGLPERNLSFRFLLSDKRLLPFTPDDGRAGLNPAFGIYHNNGSRFLYGIQSDYGLPARLGNIWQRSIPYMESRTPSSSDLKTEPSAQDRNRIYLYLSLPWKRESRELSLIGGFLSASLNDTDKIKKNEMINFSLTGGFNITGMGSETRVEAYYTQMALPQRNIGTWFSSSPPLPEREFNLYALSFVFNSSLIGMGSDIAYSQTMFYGSGIYANFALRIGNRPWRLSLSGDGASSRFVDRLGNNTGEGLRMAARYEYFWPRSGLFRIQLSLRSPGISENFNRFNFSIYYRPSAPTASQRREESFLVRFNRVSISFNRDARTPEKTLDVLDFNTAYTFGSVRGSFSSSLSGTVNLITAQGRLFFSEIDSFKNSAGISFGWGIFTLGTNLGFAIRPERKAILDFSVNLSAQFGRTGRISLRIACTEFPGRWNYTLSWRYNR